MDMILNVFQRLEIDSTIIPTFFIVILFYLLINFIFFKPLLSVIVTREKKTTKLEEEANAKAAAATQMMNEYKQKLETAYIEVQKIQKSKKSEMAKVQRAKYLAAEKEIVEKNEKEISSVLKDLSVKREEVLGKTDELSKLFVEKLT